MQIQPHVKKSSKMIENQLIILNINLKEMYKTLLGSLFLVTVFGFTKHANKIKLKGDNNHLVIEKEKKLRDPQLKQFNVQSWCIF